MTRTASFPSSSSSSSLNRLIPVDDHPLRRPASNRWLWGSLLVALLLSLLPWRAWAYAPDVLLIVLAFWALHEPRRVGLTLAFILGLLLDVQDASLLGTKAAVYVLGIYAVISLRRRLQRFSSVSQALHLLPVLVASMLLVHLLLSWLTGRWLGWGWLGSAVLTAALWLPMGALLHWPQRLADDDGDVV